MVTKCCFCFDLEFGYLAFSILTVAERFCLIFYIHYMTYSSGFSHQGMEVTGAIGFAIGYLIFAGACQCLTIKGIIQKRSVLMLPCTIISVFEMIVGTITYLVAAISFHFAIIFVLFFANAIHGYIILHHICLYKVYKRAEEFTAFSANNRSEDGLNPSAPFRV